MPRTSPSELTISLTTRPHPPCGFTRRRNAVSVMPAIGASAKGGVRSMRPIFISTANLRLPKHFWHPWHPWHWRHSLIRLHVRRIDLDADRLTDEVHRKNQAGVRTLPQQPADDAPERAVDDLDHHPFVNQRTGIELKIRLNQPSNAVDLEIRDRSDVAIERHDVDDAGTGQDREPFLRVETGEAVAREERPIDLLLAILPAAPLRDRGEERLVAFSFELLAHDVLMARAGPDGVPRV